MITTAAKLMILQGDLVDFLFTKGINSVFCHKTILVTRRNIYKDEDEMTRIKDVMKKLKITVQGWIYTYQQAVPSRDW